MVTSSNSHFFLGRGMESPTRSEIAEIGKKIEGILGVKLSVVTNWMLNASVQFYMMSP